MVIGTIGYCSACREVHELGDARTCDGDGPESLIFASLMGTGDIHRDPLWEDLIPYAIENERADETGS